MKADKDAAIITMNIVKTNHQVKVKIIQFGVNSNKARSGHKLQGVSLIEWWLDLGIIQHRIGFTWFCLD